MRLLARHLWWRQRHHRNVVLEFTDDTLSRVDEHSVDDIDLTAHLVAPLLTDLQVNGGGGQLVNNTPTPEGLLGIATAHRRLGTGTILPTVITDSFEVIEAAADAALALKSDTRVGGLHIEGPHLAVARRGTHDPRHIRPLDEMTVRLVERLRAAELPVMITLAPEQAGSSLLARLVESGAIVSGGHSAATAEQTHRAMALGLSCFTHLYNAMPPMMSRAPGILGAALDSDAHAGIIADGIHVSWEMVRIALRARPIAGRTFCVSDAMATVGGPDRFTLYGRDIQLKDGVLVNAEGSLAGAHIDLVQSLANLVEKVGLSFEEALPMVSDIPRALMRLEPTGLSIGSHWSDLLVLAEDYTMIESV